VTGAGPAGAGPALAGSVRRQEGAEAAGPRGAPPYLPHGWRALHPVARGLVLTRALRSVAQGALATDFVLYLRALGWRPGAIGSLLAASGLAGGLLGLAVGPVSDRWGRRPFLLGYQAALALATLAVLAHPHGLVLVIPTVLFGYGLGANGAAGPFAPAEQAWLARHVPAADRGAVFSLNAAAGFGGMGLGAMLAGLVPSWARWLPGPSAYAPLWVLTAAVAALNYLQIARLPEGPAKAREPVAGSRPGQAAAGDDPVTRRRENRALALLVGVNAVNALGIGISGPLLPEWFALRYGVGAAAIGSVYAVTFFATAVAAIATGELVARVGLVRSIVLVRLVGVALLAAMPLMPRFGWAAALFVVRSVLNRGSVGARQAFGVGLVRDRRRGFASSLNNVSWSLPSAAGPALAGWLMAAGSLDVPLYAGALLQLAYALLFGGLLGRYEGAGVG